MILVCDRECAAEYFKAGEHKFSFVDILTMLYFADAFSDVGIPVTRLQKLMHKTVAVRVDRFLPKIKVEAERCIARLEEQVSTYMFNRICRITFLLFKNMDHQYLLLVKPRFLIFKD